VAGKTKSIRSLRRGDVVYGLAQERDASAGGPLTVTRVTRHDDGTTTLGLAYPDGTADRATYIDTTRAAMGEP